jgi:mannose-6-phosphate isomerase-like protein (cupin superfamily)
MPSVREEDHRPWGFYIVYADEADHKVKRIVVKPGARLSSQRHFRRSEHWYLLAGEAVVTKNGVDHRLMAGQSIEIPVQTWHRIHNPAAVPLEFIEIQTGSYFGEDDIERGEDDYGRK